MVLFRPSRPDFIETRGPCRAGRHRRSGPLFRPSRPDFIETGSPCEVRSRVVPLFRPSRPDFIETAGVVVDPFDG